MTYWGRNKPNCTCEFCNDFSTLHFTVSSPTLIWATKRSFSNHIRVTSPPNIRAELRIWREKIEAFLNLYHVQAYNQSIMAHSVTWWIGLQGSLVKRAINIPFSTSHLTIKIYIRRQNILLHVAWSISSGDRKFRMHSLFSFLRLFETSVL